MTTAQLGPGDIRLQLLDIGGLPGLEPVVVIDSELQATGFIPAQRA